MTRHRRQHPIVQRFGDRERERLIKLFRQLGTENIHESEAARGRIDSLLRSFGKSWSDILHLLSGASATLIRADIAVAIVALGSSDPDVYAKTRIFLKELLARHRKNWNDLVDELRAIAPASWVNTTSADPERVNPLGLIIFLLKEYVALREPHEYLVVALWILHTHVYDRFMCTPRLVLRSPVANCGKTVLIDVMSRLVARPQIFDSITAAALYRLIDSEHPTLLVDEADNLVLGMQANGKLRAIFNSGHRQGHPISITVDGEVRKFQTFSPIVLALPDSIIGLPRTLNSRSLTLMMQRHDGSRKLQRFDVNHPDHVFDPAYGQVLLWLREDLRCQPLNADPEMPAENRFADNWRPLISVADSLGYGVQAREAMMKFAHEDADVRIVLLSDIRKAFDMHAADRLPSTVLLSALHDLDADWNEFHGIRGDGSPHKLRASELGSMLREFRIRPSNIWPPNRTADSKSAKGYRRAQFEDAWSVYCADDGTTAQASNIRSLRRGDSGTV